MRQILPLTLGLGLLSACVEYETVERQPARPLPGYFWETFNDGFLADSIASECRSIRFADPPFDADLERLFFRLYADNYTDYDIEYGIDHADEAALQKVAFDYIEDNNILISESETWCRAGRAEIRKGSRIGRYLKSRRG